MSIKKKAKKEDSGRFAAVALVAGRNGEISQMFPRSQANLLLNLGRRYRLDSFWRLRDDEKVFYFDEELNELRLRTDEQETGGGEEEVQA